MVINASAAVTLLEQRPEKKNSGYYGTNYFHPSLLYLGQV